MCKHTEEERDRQRERERDCVGYFSIAVINTKTKNSSERAYLFGAQVTAHHQKKPKHKLKAGA